MAMETRVDTPAAYPANPSAEGNIVTVRDAMHETRGLKLIPTMRALRSASIHELIATDGVIVGFDETHEPNHINIVIGVAQRRSGPQLNISIGSRIRFVRR